MNKEDKQNEYHRFFPVVKYLFLRLLQERQAETTREFIEKMPKTSPAAIIANLYRFKKARLVKRSKEGDTEIWTITKWGRQHLQYLKDRLENEFDGAPGFFDWVERRRAEAIEKRN